MNKLDNPARRGRDPRVLGARPRRPAAGVARCTATAPATCSTTSWRRCPRVRRGPRDRGRQRRDHRPAERRQVLAVQPPRRRRALDRERGGGHDARRARHGGGARRHDATGSWTPPGCAAQAKIDESVEYYSFVRAMRAIDRADVALLVVDVVDRRDRPGPARRRLRRGARLRDRRAAQQVGPARGRRGARERIEEQIPRQLGFVGYAPVLRISALTGRGVDTHLRPDRHRLRVVLAQDHARARSTSCSPSCAQFGHTVTKGPRQLRVNYATQTREKPPGFTFFANHPRLADENFKRYLENRMRETFDFTGTPIILKFRQKE